MFTMIHGRKVVLINGRHYAVDDRNHGIADRIAQRTNSTCNTFERVQRSARNNNTRGFR
jgi:predicted nucleotide-binding protein (sugar kinase/HSP70/actin superfamily)